MSTFRRRNKNRKSLNSQNTSQRKGSTKRCWANHFTYGRRLQIETLEDRCVLSAATVNTPLDIIDLGDGKTSLREAIFFTNTLIGPDTIEFDPSLNGETISLTQGELKITDALTILGPGANKLTISALGSDPTPGVKNGDGSRIFNIDNANDDSIIKVVLSGLTLTAGDVALSGGAVFSREDVTIDLSTFSGNSALQDGGAVASLAGSLQIVRTTISNNSAANAGGIFAIGQSVLIDQSSLFNNTALTGDGGGLFSGNDSLTITSSTFSGNTAFDRGGGMSIEPRASGTAVVQHSTITNNHAAGGGGIDISLAPLSIDHTIVAGNLRNPTGRDDISGAVAARFSLIGDGTGATITNNGGNLIGTSTLPINAMLGPLADNGGPTLTHALLASSPAVDAGDLAAIAGVNAPLYDQRGPGFERIENGAASGARIDIGAYEIQSGSIHGYKWNDLDGNGIWDQVAEPGLPGWIVFLDTNKNGALDGGETWTVTDANGAYSFDGLAPAYYTVGEVMLPGWTQTKPGPPQATSLIVNGNFEAGNLSGWTASSGWVINKGTVDPTSPDGPLPPYAGTYSALLNSTGTRDIYQTVTLPSNTPLTLRWANRIRNFYTSFGGTQQVRVEVRNTANQVLATLFSTQPSDTLLQNWKEQSADISGFAGQTVRIAFVVVASSSYLNLHLDNVRITQGFEQGQIPVSVGDGQTVNSVDFGNWIVPTGEIHGFKWNDLNGDGVWDQPSEPGLANWKIYLDANNNGALDPSEKWTTTAADGSYSFTGLPAGNYVVSELVEAGWVQTSPARITPPLIVNGGFETGTLTGWTLSPTTAFVINNGTVDPPSTDGPLPPYQGSFSALSYATSSSGIYMYQDVTIPAQSHLTLHWADQIRNFYSSGFVDPSQEYRLEIRNLSNTVLATPFSTNPGDPNQRGWTERSVDLSAYAGQTIRIAFAKTATSNYLDIHLDNIRITDDRPVAPVYVSLHVGEVVNSVNFGNWVSPHAEIHGFKWNDLNGDSQWQQPAEPALEGVVVYIDSNADGSLEFGEPWTTTSADGSYAFTDLAPGDYVVMEVVPPGWTQTSPTNVNLQVGPERLFGVRGSGAALTIFEFDRTTGATIRSYTAPTTGSVGSQGLALGPHSLFFIEGSSSSLAHTLWELNPDTGAVIDSDVIDGTNAGAIDGLAYLNGKVYIEKYSTNQIVVWDTVADTTITTLTVGIDLIGGLTGAADLGVLFAVNNTGTIYRLDPNTGAVLSAMPPATSYAGIGLAYINGELIAVRSGTSGTAYRINPTSGAVLGTLTLSGTGSMSALAGDGATATAARGAQLVTLAANQIVTGMNFGNWIAPPGEIHGYKWNDLDGDGIWDQPTEPALSGWLIYLDANHNGSLDGGERWTMTAADGSYSFTNLPAGEYFVAEMNQPGWTQSYPNAAHQEFERLFEVRGATAATTIIMELDPVTGIGIRSFAAPVTSSLGSQGLAVGVNSLFYIDGSSSTTHVLYELNPDTGAVMDSDIVDTSLLGTVDGLAYLNGLVYIQKPGVDRILVWNPVTDTLVTTLTVAADLGGGLTGAADLGLLFATSSNGNIFAIDPNTGAVYATYTPAISTPAAGLAYINGQLIAVRSGTTGSANRIDPYTGAILGSFTVGGIGTVGGLGGDGVSSVSRGTHIVNVAPGQSALDINFGNWIAPLGEIRGHKWNDRDSNGIWDQPPEPGLAGWQIFIDANGNGLLDPTEASTTTGADGSYAFLGLSPGTYNVAEVLQPNWVRTFSQPFVVVGAGAAVENVNFGNHSLPGTIAGQFWNDLNGDGIKDSGEPALTNWTVYLDQNANGTFDAGERSTLTNTSGSYVFSNVEVGTYQVAEVLQLNWTATHTPAAVQVSEGANVTNVNFGNHGLPGEIRGYKWNDLDSDGIWDQPTEPGLAGWQIFIDANGNGLLDPTETSTTTGTDGSYAFTGLSPNTYSILDVLQPNWVRTFSPLPVVLDAGAAVDNSNFGNHALPGTIAGQLWNDLNGDGIKDSGEPALTNWTVYLDRNANGTLDSGEHSTLTNTSGNYLFSNIEMGTYLIAEVLQLNWTATLTPATVEVLPGANVTNVNFGNHGLPGEIRGYKWNDLDNDGIWDQPTEPGLAGWQIFIDANGNGLLDPTEASTTTGADGSYAFTGLSPGTYNLAEVLQPNWVRTFSPLPVVLDAGAAVENINFGNHALPGTIAGQLWNDLNGDGIKDSGEPALANWTVYLDQNANGTFDAGERSTLTNTSGNYLFSGVEVGTYLVAEVLQLNWTATHTPAAVQVLPGANVTNVNFGNHGLPGEIRGYKWSDRDSDGIWDQPTEPGLAGWQIFIDANGNGLLDPTETSTTTGTDGSYAFTGLSPGTYNLAEVLQPNWVRTFSQSFVVLGAGAIFENINFGSHALPGTVAGRVWNDLNGDGIWDSGEQALTNWTVYLDQNANGTFDAGERSTLTNTSGNYLFLGVEVGTYLVAEVLQLNWTATHTPAAVQVLPGANVTNVDFGNHGLPGLIRGYKWNDLDGDGVWDPIEPGLQGWTIFLDVNENGVLDPGEKSAVTNAEGSYVLTNVAPNSYLVKEVPQAGWESVSPSEVMLRQLLSHLAVNNSSISALVPFRYNFQEGYDGNEINEGGNNMYNDGNQISSTSYNGIPYTNGALVTSDHFGQNSKYFTAKYPGLFVFAAAGMSQQTQFKIDGYTGITGHDGDVDGTELSTTVGGQQYTVFVKRIYNGTIPSINHLIIVPGTGFGIQQDFLRRSPQNDYHILKNPYGFEDLFYLLVSSANGRYISDSDVLNIANAFLADVDAASIKGSTRITVAPGQSVMNVNFASFALPTLPGDYNRNGDVDAADFVTWRKSLGQPSSLYYGADGNGNGMVDPTDYDVWRTHFGQTGTVTGSLAANAGEQATQSASLVSTATLFSDSTVPQSASLAAALDTSIARLPANEVTASAPPSYSSNSSELQPTLDSGTKIRHMSAIAASELSRWQDEGLLALISQRLAGRSKADLQIDPDVPTDCTHSADVYFESYGEKAVDEAGDVIGARPVSAFAVQGKRPMKRSLGSRLR